MDDAIGGYFGGSNPLSYNLVAGEGFNYQMDDSLNVAAAYLGREASSAGNDLGLTGGDNTAFAQVTFTPSDKLVLAGTYNRAYYSVGDGIAGGTESYSVDAFGVNAGYALASKLNVSGWAGFGSADSDADADRPFQLGCTAQFP